MPRPLALILCAALCAAAGILAWQWPRAGESGLHGGEPAPPWGSPQPLPPPAPGTWRAVFHEQPQSLEQYKADAPIRPTADRRTIVLQPLGDFPPARRALLDTMRKYAEVFFQLPARIAAPLPLDHSVPGLTREGPDGETQYSADLLLHDTLKKMLPSDAIAVLGITLEDLYSGDLNYVFGLASTTDRVGVYSLCRYFPEFWGQPATPDTDRLALLRACKVLNHETGHMFGLDHCLYYQCSMNGANSLPETDAAPIHYCPICEEKITWNIGMVPKTWWRALDEFYRHHQLIEVAD